jgi:hypothetical protein
MKEFLLPYDAVRQSHSPETALMDFLQSTYEAGANLAKWDRAAWDKPISTNRITVARSASRQRCLNSLFILPPLQGWVDVLGI